LAFTPMVPEGQAPRPFRSRLIEVLRPKEKAGSKDVRTVLVIDDEPALVELLSRTLLARGFSVLQALTAKRGLELAATGQPDVIILDLTMPEYSGTQVVEQLRAQPETKRIPILIHTGTVLAEEERQHLATQVQSITCKTEPQHLLADLERVGELQALVE
jgi:CheY-like chemotaxis protein